MLEYFTYQKVKKHQAEKAARDAAAAREEDPSSTTSSGTATPSKAAGIPLPQTPDLTPSPQPQIMQQDTHTLTIPRKPLPVLTAEDEDFLRGFVDDEDTPDKRPVLPNRPVIDGLKEAGDASGNESQVVVSDKQHGKKETYGEYVGDFVGGIKNRFAGKGKEKEKEHEDIIVEEKKDKGKGKENDKHEGGRFGFVGRTFSKKEKKPEVAPVVSPEEAEAEKEDITAVLDSLNLSAVNNRAFSVSAESQAVLEKFTVILKDLVNGVPTAFDDLTHLLDDSSDTLKKGYENLPSFLQKLVAQLPTKLTGNLGPELMATMAAGHGMSATEAGTATAGGFGAAAKSFLTPTSLKDLVTKPGAVVSLLKTIMNFLKFRFPAFMGTNVLFSMGLFILLFVFWYCHKRGREERLKREGEPVVVDSEGRIIELEDDPLLPSSEPGPSTIAGDRTRSQSRTGRQIETTLRPDVGATEGGNRSRPTSASSWRSGRSLRRKKETEEIVAKNK